MYKVSGYSKLLALLLERLAVPKAPNPAKEKSTLYDMNDKTFSKVNNILKHIIIIKFEKQIFE